MSDTPEHGLDLPATPVGDGRRNRQLLLAAGVVAAALLGGGVAALLTGDTPAPPRAASPSVPSLSALPTPPALPTASPTAGTPTPTPTPTPTDPSPASPPAPTAGVPGLVEQSGDAVWFRTPSGNIGCVMTPTSAACDLQERTWEPPPRPADCELDYGQGVFLDGDQAGVTCAGDTQFVPDAPVLAYGSGWVLGSVRCTSAEDGVTCVNTSTTRGFSVSRDQFQLR